VFSEDKGTSVELQHDYNIDNKPQKHFSFDFIIIAAPIGVLSILS
jgi:hypothetical protein